jgi:hypothetical protein
MTNLKNQSLDGSLSATKYALFQASTAKKLRTVAAINYVSAAERFGFIPQTKKWEAPGQCTASREMANKCVVAS